MLHGDEQYTRMFGWPEPFADGLDKKQRYAEVEDATNRRMAEIFDAALSLEEAKELARLSTAALVALAPTCRPPGAPCRSSTVRFSPATRSRGSSAPAAWGRSTWPTIRGCPAGCLKVLGPTVSADEEFRQRFNLRPRWPPP